MKKCTKCGEVKELTAFSKRTAAKDGYQAYCKSCTKTLKTKWNKKNRKKCQHYCKNYRENHPDQFYKSIKIWTNQHQAQVQKIKHRSYKKNYKKQQKIQKERYQNDIIFKLTHLLRTRLNIAIKRNYKSGSAVRDLGCTIDELKIYLESLFQYGMTWENHGKNGWEIDHIIPLSCFDLTNRDQFLQACHYTNLQPLWAIDNQKKSNKFI